MATGASTAITSPTGILEQFERLAKAAAIAAAGLYVLGLLTANQYLLFFGVTDFASLRPRCILAGALTMVLLAAFALPALVPLWFVTYVEPRGLKQYSVLAARILAFALLGTVILILFVPFMFAELRVNVRNLKDELSVALYLLYNANIAVLVPWLMWFAASDIKRLKPFRSTIGGFGLLIALMWFSHRVASGPYDLIPQVFGGGEPVAAQLVLNQDGVDVWKRIGGEFMCKCDSDVRTGTVVLVFENDRELILAMTFRQTETGEMFSHRPVIINKSLVNAVIPADEVYWHEL
jgi:hypothetical protein